MAEIPSHKQLDYQVEVEYGYLHCNWNEILPNEVRIWINGESKFRLNVKDVPQLIEFLINVDDEVNFGGDTDG